MYDRRVDADFAIELGADDETLEFPWQDPDGRLHYYDLKRHPELLAKIEEASRVPELGAFLAGVNSPAGSFETAKCDAWVSADISPEEQTFGKPVKFASYVDLLFSEELCRFSFADHERFVRRITRLLQAAPEVAAAVQFLIRRCFYLQRNEVRDGFYVTFYLFGYGDEEEAARARWNEGLKLVDNALRQP